MIISIIVAIGKNRQIGMNNQLLWHIPEDLKNFKRLTMGHHILMGRKTFESIGRILPGRTSLILSRKQDLKIEGAKVVNSFSDGVDMAQEASETELFIIGGAQLYQLAFSHCQRIYLTQTQYDGPADVFFPEFEFSKFKVTQQQKWAQWEYTVLER